MKLIGEKERKNLEKYYGMLMNPARFEGAEPRVTTEKERDQIAKKGISRVNEWAKNTLKGGK